MHDYFLSSRFYSRFYPYFGFRGAMVRAWGCTGLSTGGGALRRAGTCSGPMHGKGVTCFRSNPEALLCSEGALGLWRERFDA